MPRGDRRTILLGLLCGLAVAVALAPFLIRKSETVYTDGAALREPETRAESVLREVLWETPVSLEDSFDFSGSDGYEPCILPDGAAIFFTVGRPGNDADIFIARRRRDTWQKLERLRGINSSSDDLGAALDPGGSTLAFYSDRPGGFGGYDIWLSARDGDRWSKPINAGRGVNSPFNEMDPALADDGRLFFSSDRAEDPGSAAPWKGTIRAARIVGDYDIYVSRREAGGAFAAATPVLALNTRGGAEGALALSPAGDFLYFSSNRVGGAGGFDLYRSRLLGQEFLAPENLGPRINTRADELDPALSAGGFELYLVRSRDDGEHLFRTTSREVFRLREEGDRYLTISALLGWLRDVLSLVHPAILALVLSLILCALFLLLFGRRYGRLGVLTRCFLIALLAHLVAALWMNSHRVQRWILETIPEAETFEAFEVSVGGMPEEDVGVAIREATADTEGDVPPVLEATPRTAPVRTTEPREREAPAWAPRPAAVAAREVREPEVAVATVVPDPESVPAVEARPPAPPETNPPELRAPELSAHSPPPPPEETAGAPTELPPLAARERVFQSVEATDHLEELRAEAPGGAPAPATAPEAPLAEPPTWLDVPDTGLARPALVGAVEPLERDPPDPFLPRAPTVPAGVEDEEAPAPLPLGFGAPRAPVRSEEETTALTRSAPPPVATGRVPEVPAPGAPDRPEVSPRIDLAARTAEPLPLPRALRRPLSAEAPRLGSRSAPPPRPRSSEEATQGASDAATARLPLARRRQSFARPADSTAGSVPLPPPVRDLAPLAESPIASPATRPRALDIVSALPVRLPSANARTAEPETKFMPRLYRLRQKDRRTEVLLQGGGTPATEASVERGLRWLALHQSPDGRWSLDRYTEHLQDVSDRDLGHPDWNGRGRRDSRGSSYKGTRGDTAGTGLALLAFLGHGDSHLDPGPHRETVERGLDWLLGAQRPDGDLRDGGNMYMHGIASFALCEAYAFTRDPGLRDAARRALAFTVSAQNPKLGGWRYEPYPRGKDVDTSVFGWMLMAVKSARLGELPVDATCLERAARYLDSARTGPGGGRYAYQPRQSRTSLAMTAQGFFSQQILAPVYLEQLDREAVKLRRADEESIRYLLSNLPEAKDQEGVNFYYWYYATLALFQEGGPAWKTWNEVLSNLLLQLQVGEEHGSAAGSWDPRSRRAQSGGRVYSTALSILCLEVYYRYARIEDEPARQEEDEED